MTAMTDGTTVPAGGSVGGWSVERHAVVDSTQRAAHGRPAWTAVVAGEQAAGRGQAGRTFASDPGGLYVTAVLPYAGDPLATRGFALAVGWALREMLVHRGVRSLRLRWPNDLMVGARKVGGILVEQDGPATLLVGVGLNVRNHPWRVDPQLVEIAGRLADACEGGPAPEPEEWVPDVLAAIRRAHEVFAREHLAGMGVRLHAAWGPSREVVLEPAGAVADAPVRGWFEGIDAEGRVLVRIDGDGVRAIPAHRIGRLREVG